MLAVAHRQAAHVTTLADQYADACLREKAAQEDKEAIRRELMPLAIARRIVYTSTGASFSHVAGQRTTLDTKAVEAMLGARLPEFQRSTSFDTLRYSPAVPAHMSVNG